MLCDETKEHTADILMPHEMRKGNHSSFLMPTEVGGRCPLPPEICGQSDPPPLTKADFDVFSLIVPAP